MNHIRKPLSRTKRIILKEYKNKPILKKDVIIKPNIIEQPKYSIFSKPLKDLYQVWFYISKDIFVKDKINFSSKVELKNSNIETNIKFIGTDIVDLLNKTEEYLKTLQKK